MAYEAKTQNNLAKWWVIGTGSVVNRLSEIMDDCPLGPAIYYTTGWTTGTLGIALTVSINNGGTGYTVADVLTLTGGGNDCTVTVATVSSGVITGITLTTGGTGYATGNYNVTGGTGGNDAIITIATITVEYYRTQATANDSTDEKIGVGAWAALAAGTGIGALAAGQYFFDVGTTRLYVRLTGDVIANATNQVRAHYVWDGAGAGPVFMTEVVEDGLYQIHLNMDLGEGTTSTTLASLKEIVRFDTNVTFNKTGNTTLTMGELQSGGGASGPIWSFDGTGIFTYGYNGGLNMTAYGAVVEYRANASALVALKGTWTDCIFNFNSSTAGSYLGIYAPATVTRGAVLFSLSTGRIDIAGAVTVSDTISNCSQLTDYASVNITVPGVVLTNTSIEAKVVYAYTLTLVDITEPTTKTIVNASGIIKLNYTVAIHIADRKGVNLSGATVTWLDSQGNTGNTTTDANGNLTAAFTLTSKQWAGTSETLTDYNTFTFTITKAGYKKLVLENITLSEAIDWHLELQQNMDNNFSKRARMNT